MTDKSVLTAEQVREAIFNGSAYASYDGAKYYADGIHMQAIADELNTRTERTCKIDYERHCSNCGVHVHESAVLVRKGLGEGIWTFVSKPASYCPNCGARVVD